MKNLLKNDLEIAELIKKEKERQDYSIRLIPSENYVSDSVLEATGSILTNKYSEGYPKKRYYEGQEFVDTIEQIAIDRAKKLFGAYGANVQALSGSPANLGVMLALLNPGDKIMGMALTHGGHLTHGWKVSATGKFYNAVQYNLQSERDYLSQKFIRQSWIKNKLADDGKEVEFFPNSVNQYEVFDGRAKIDALWRPYNDGYIVTITISNNMKIDSTQSRKKFNIEQNEKTLFEVELKCIIESGDIDIYLMNPHTI